MTTANAAENQILEQFQSFRRRWSRRERWHQLLSGLIVVFALWLLARIAGQLLNLPMTTFVANALLLIGIVFTLIKVYQTGQRQRTAAYVFDRIHDLDGMFLTLQSLRIEDALTEETKRMRGALAGRIRERLPEEPVLSFAFPTTRAFACVLLLVMGIVLPETSFLPSSSTTNDSKKLQSRTNIRDVKKDNGTKTGAESVNEKSGSNQKFEQLMDRFDRLQQKPSKEGNEAKMQELRELKQDMTSYLNEQGQSSTSDAPGESTNDSGTFTQTGEDKPSSQSTPGNGSGSTGSGDDVVSDGQVPNNREQRRSGSRENTKTRTIKRAIQRLETSITRSASSDNRGATADSRREAPATSVPPDALSQDVGTVQESGSFPVNWDRIGEAVRRPRTIQNWHPRYDRSISRYRSRLESFVSSRNKHHGSD